MSEEKPAATAGEPSRTDATVADSPAGTPGRTVLRRVLACAGTGAVAALLFFAALGRMPFYDKAEPREALQVREEVDAGQWILPLRNGTEIPSKPPLYHWLAGLVSLAAGGVSEWSTRMPSAVLALLTVLLVCGRASGRWGPFAGLVAGIALATSFEWLRAARGGRVDMTLAACLTVAFLAFERAATASRPPRAALALFYLATALAVLAKGPVGGIFPVLVALLYLALRRDLGRIRHLHLRSGVMLILFLAGGWYLLATWQGGMPFVQKQILQENLLRFLGTKSGTGSHVHPFHYYLPRFAAGFLPWSLFLVPATVLITRARKQLDERGLLYPLLWFAVVFLFYSASAGKRSVYILPVYPAAALLVAAWWAELATGRMEVGPRIVRALRVLVWVLPVLLAPLLLVVVAERLGLSPLSHLESVLHARDRANLPLVSAMIGRHSLLLAGWVLCLFLLAAALGWSLRKLRWRSAFACTAAATGGSALLIAAVLQPELAAARTFKPFLTEVNRMVSAGDRLAFYDTFDYGAAFYAHRHVPVLHGDPRSFAAGGRAYLLLRESAWDALPAATRQTMRRLATSKAATRNGRLVLARIESPARPGDEATPPAEDSLKEKP